MWAIYGFRYLPSASPTWVYDLQTDAQVQREVPKLASVVTWIDRHHLVPNVFSQGFLFGQAKAQVRPAFLNGEINDRGWWYYFPVAFAIKTPIAILALIAGGLVLVALRWRQLGLQDVLFVVLPIAVYTAAAMATRLNIGLRHLLPIYPLLLLLVAAAAKALLDRGRAGTIVLAAALAVGAVEFGRNYPDNLAFFNAFVGGPARGSEYLVDSNLDWGQDLKPLKAWMDANHVPHINLAYFGTAYPPYYGIDATYLAGVGVLPARRERAAARVRRRERHGAAGRVPRRPGARVLPVVRSTGRPSRASGTRSSCTGSSSPGGRASTMSAKKPKRPRATQPTQPQTAPAVRPSASPQLWLLFAGLVLLTLAVYYPAWHGGMLWDDDAHITRVDLRSLSGLWRIWFDVGATQQYYPAAHSAFWVFYQLWGDNTLGYHLANIVLHASSAFLVAVILRRLAIPGAVLAALIFAVHPVNVESVAWMTELKNTLSGVCYLGAALMYLRFDESRERRWYALAAGLFVLALFSKTVTATLPAALLVIFWWQRGRIRWREDVVPLLPFFATGVAGGLLTSVGRARADRRRGPGVSVHARRAGLIAGRAFWFYLGKLVWPADLIFIYPRWQVSQQVAWQYAYPTRARRAGRRRCGGTGRDRARRSRPSSSSRARCFRRSASSTSTRSSTRSSPITFSTSPASGSSSSLRGGGDAGGQLADGRVGRDRRAARARRDQSEPPVRGCGDAVSHDAQPESVVLDGVHQSREAAAGGGPGAGRRSAAARGGRDAISVRRCGSSPASRRRTTTSARCC